MCHAVLTASNIQGALFYGPRMWSITESVRKMLITRTLEPGMTVGLFGMGPEWFCRRPGCA